MRRRLAQEVLNLRSRVLTPQDFTKISRSMPLREVMLDYCNRLGLVYGKVRFTCDGVRLREDKTGGELEMEDDDVIDAWSDFLGGGGDDLRRTIKSV
ncbi:hypothetical protein ACSBR1_039782 [Camellia fascicularis]